MSNTQELFNKLRIKREFAMADVVTRLSLDEVDTLLLGLRQLGVDEESAEDAIYELKNPTSPYEENRTWSTVQIKSEKSKRNRKGIVIHHNTLALFKELEVAFASGTTQLFTADEVKFVERDVELEETIRNKKVVSVYTWEGRQVRVLTGKHHFKIGYAHVDVWKSKPLKVIFPSGEIGHYFTNQLAITEKKAEGMQEALLLQRRNENKHYNRMLRNLEENQ